MSHRLPQLLLLLVPAALAAQDNTALQQILNRLDRLEKENRELQAEVNALRNGLGFQRPAAAVSQPEAINPVAINPVAINDVPPIPLEERVAVQERRIEEQQQTKVEASQRFPLSLTGMVLFNAFLNGKATGNEQFPTLASPYDYATGGGASFSQTILGLNYQGPRVWGGGQVRGSLYMDFFGSGTAAYSLNQIRLRTATIGIDWKNRSLSVGQDKPIVAPRNPDSLAQVAYSPLSDAGNLWLWQPQIRYEERFAFGEKAGLKAQAGVYQTSEPIASAGDEYKNSLATARPALQGRFEVWRKIASSARIEIAPGFHVSQTHVGDVSIPSRLFTLDWLIQPLSKVRITGAYFSGKNTAGLGGLRQGFVIVDDERHNAVRAIGGWTQFAYSPTNRLTFNLYGGQESNRAADLLYGQVTRNLVYAANAIYKIGPNIHIGFESAQARTRYLGYGTRLVNHYDIALAYLF